MEIKDGSPNSHGSVWSVHGVRGFVTVAAEKAERAPYGIHGEGTGRVGAVEQDVFDNKARVCTHGDFGFVLEQELYLTALPGGDHIPERHGLALLQGVCPSSLFQSCVLNDTDSLAHGVR